MTDSNKTSKTNSTNKNQKNLKDGKIQRSKAEQDLRDEIVEQAKLLTNQKTSSAFGIIMKTRELLKIEDMQKV